MVDSYVVAGFYAIIDRTLTNARGIMQSIVAAELKGFCSCNALLIVKHGNL
jgi:hypothetical protein